MDVDLAQAAHPQHIHLELWSIRSRSSARIRSSTPLISTRSSLITTSPGANRSPPGCPVDLRQQRAHRVVDAGDHRMSPRDRRGLAETPI
jgi:hypothetical protein